MIVACLVPLEVGKVVKSDFIADSKGVRHDHQPARIMREATYDEWVRNVLDGGGIPYLGPEFPVPELVHFYQISID